MEFSKFCWRYPKNSKSEQNRNINQEFHSINLFEATLKFSFTQLWLYYVYSTLLAHTIFYFWQFWSRKYQSIQTWKVTTNLEFSKFCWRYPKNSKSEQNQNISQEFHSINPFEATLKFSFTQLWLYYVYSTLLAHTIFYFWQFWSRKYQKVFRHEK